MMADDSPGKVQALRALFLEKNGPVMGVMPLPRKPPVQSWKSSSNSFDENALLKERCPDEQIFPSQTMNKVLPYTIKRVELSYADNAEAQNGYHGVSVKPTFIVPAKPNIGPKPLYLSQIGRTSSSNTLNSISSDSNDSMSGNENVHADIFRKKDMYNSQVKSKAVAETIASFMFSNSNKSVYHKNVLTETVNRIESNDIAVHPMIPKPQISELTMTNDLQDNSKSLLNKVPSETITNSCSNLIASDNYISKSNCYFRRRTLPPKEKLGSAPLKPFRPPHLKLNSKEQVTPDVINSLPEHKPPLLESTPAPALPQKPPIHRPSYPCPPRPVTSPPLPPVIKPFDQRRSPITSLREEIEELYEDTLLQNKDLRPSSLIPEYTEEEESGDLEMEELYNDAEVPILPAKPNSIKPKSIPYPSEYLQPKVHHSSVEELYQDAQEPDQDQFYEEMPIDCMHEEPGAPLYSNNRKEIEKLKKEEEKKQKKEQKEKEKKDRETEKIKKKFGLTGDEVPIDAGLVKSDCRGSKGDLTVKKGETVLILRMEGNPSGRWLVKNEKGKIGYVELTNIEVDPDSVKSVMTIRRLSVISASEELYSEAMSEEEGIYEVTY